MAFKKSSAATTLLIIFATVALCAVSSSMAAEYQVGWTIGRGIDYQGWSSTKNFHAGDVLVFNYNNQFHNVKQVTRQDFQSCNPASPLATYSNGSDAVTLDKPGQYYFICGFPGHCFAGQKVHVSVTTASQPPNPSPAPAPSPSPTNSKSYSSPSSNPSLAPSPTPTNSESSSKSYSSPSPNPSPAPTPTKSSSSPSPSPSPAPAPTPTPAYHHLPRSLRSYLATFGL